MLYYVPLPLVKGEPEVNVVLLCRVSIDGKNKYIDFRQMLGTDQTINTLQNYGERVKVVALEKGKEWNTETPIFPVVPPDGSPNGTLGAAVLYNFMKGKAPLTVEVANAVATKVTNGNTSMLDGETVLKFQEAFMLFEKYLKGEEKFKIKTPDLNFLNPSITISAVREWNAKMGPQFNYITPELNKTSYMTDSLDTFFVKLPEYERLKSHDTPIEDLIPNTSEIANPYPHPIYTTPYYREIFKLNPEQQRQQLSQIAKVAPDGVFKPADLKGVPRIDFANVEGNVENNELDIQANEEDFYHALTEYIKYDIAQSFPGRDVEELYKSCTASPRMVEFLNDLIDKMAVMNWFHCGYFPVTYLSEDEDSESGGSEDVSEREYFQTGKPILDGPLFLHKFISMAASESGAGFGVYVEAIIKLARWGAVKPTMLKLDSYNKFFDLNTFMITNSTGSLASLQPVLIDGKYEMAFRGLVTFEDKFRDLEYKRAKGYDVNKIAVPVGIVGERRFAENKHQLVFMSFIDLINAYRGGANNLIKGIHLTPSGEFSVDVPGELMQETLSLRYANQAVETSADKMHVFYESSVVKSLKLEFGVNSLASISVLFEFLYAENKLTKMGDLLSFNSKEELQQKIMQVALPKDVYVRTNIATQIVPVVLEANMAYEQDEVEFKPDQDKLKLIIEEYLKAMTKLGFTNEAQKWANGGQALVAEAPTGAMSKLMAFSKSAEGNGGTVAANTPDPAPVTPAPAKPSAPSDDIVLQEESETEVHPNIIPFKEGDRKITFTHNGEIIGCFTVVTEGTRKLYVIGGKGDVPEGAKPSANTLTSLQALFMDFILCTLEFRPTDSQLRFSSPEVVKEFRLYFKDLHAKETEARKKAGN